MKKIKLIWLGKASVLLCLFLLVTSFSTCFSQSETSSDFRYAVVIKQSTYSVTRWKQVCDTLLSRYKGHLFIWDSALLDLKEPLASYSPTHICYVCEISTATPSFIMNVLYQLPGYSMMILIAMPFGAYLQDLRKTLTGLLQTRSHIILKHFSVGPSAVTCLTSPRDSVLMRLPPGFFILNTPIQSL